MWSTPLIDGLALGGEAGDDHRRAGPDVVGPAPARRTAAGTPRTTAWWPLVRMSAPSRMQLLDVAEPARVEVLGDDADTVGDAQHRDDQRLVVGGDARVRQRLHVDRAQPPSAAHRQRRGPTPSSSRPMSANRASRFSMCSARASRIVSSPPVTATAARYVAAWMRSGDGAVVGGPQRAAARRRGRRASTCRCPRCRRPSRRASRRGRRPPARGPRSRSSSRPRRTRPP